MSTASLPSYVAPLQPSYSRIPSYSVEPGIYEQRLALNARLQPQPTGNFVKSSKGGDAKLRLSAQHDKIDLPVYGSGGVVEGTVELAKTDNISTVEVEVEGRLQLKEIAEGGHTDATICLNSALLWTKDTNNPVCPPSLHFSLTLPTTFEHEGRSYPLPPSHSIKLKGVPGFHASIDYSVSVIIDKPLLKSKKIGIMVNKKLGINIGNTTLSTPFIYHPRTRPPVPIPSPLVRTEGGFTLQPEWRVYDSVLKANNSKAGAQDIQVKFYLPASRIFCASATIPFHVSFFSTAYSLALFLPYGPTTRTSGKLRATRIQLMRQSTVDVRGTTIHGTKTDIWRVDPIGEAVFRHAGDGPTWMSFSGEIEIAPVKVMGFKIAGLHVQDYILLTVTPPDVTKSPFVNIRETIPVRLTTDPWTEDGRGLGARPSLSVPPSPQDSDSPHDIARAL